MTVEDQIAEAYERGAFVQYQRAISRAELGLPIERGVEPSEPISGYVTAMQTDTEWAEDTRALRGMLSIQKGGYIVSYDEDQE